MTTEGALARFSREIPAGSVLFREGESGEEMYVIQAGHVRITKRVARGERVLATLGPGEFLGEMAILNEKPRSATVRVRNSARSMSDPSGSEVLLHISIAYAPDELS